MVFNWDTDHVCYIDGARTTPTGHDFFWALIPIFIAAMQLTIMMTLAANFSVRAPTTVAKTDPERQSLQPKTTEPNLFRWILKALLVTASVCLAPLLIM